MWKARTVVLRMFVSKCFGLLLYLTELNLALQSGARLYQYVCVCVFWTVGVQHSSCHRPHCWDECKLKRKGANTEHIKEEEEVLQAVLLPASFFLRGTFSNVKKLDYLPRSASCSFTESFQFYMCDLLFLSLFCLSALQSHALISRFSIFNHISLLFRLISVFDEQIWKIRFPSMFASRCRLIDWMICLCRLDVISLRPSSLQIICLSLEGHTSVLLQQYIIQWILPQLNT